MRIMDSLVDSLPIRPSELVSSQFWILFIFESYERRKYLYRNHIFNGDKKLSIIIDGYDLTQYRSSGSKFGFTVGSIRSKSSSFSHLLS